MIDPTFDDRGQYVLDTDEQRAAAMFASLRAISVASRVYHHGEAREMARIASEILQGIRAAEAADAFADEPTDERGIYEVHADEASPDSAESVEFRR
jgi:hypothetical protein